MRFAPQVLKFLAILAVAFSLSGCLNDSPDNDYTSSMGVVPSLGLIRGADVVILDAAGTPIQGASGVLGADGEVSLTYPANLSGPILIEVRGNATATYFDESTGTFLPFPAGQRLRTWLAEPKASVGVTPLTEIAASLIEAAGPVTAASINTATNNVRLALAPDVADITAPPALVSDTTAAGSLTDTDAGRYAAILAGLANLGSGATAPALAVMEQLRADLADGVIDGVAGGVAITDLAYTPASFAADLIAEIAAATAQLGNTALQNRTFTPPSTSIGGGGGNGGGDNGGGDNGGGDNGGGDNGGGDTEAPSGIELVIALAGTYTVDTSVSTHTRGTIIIGVDGSVDFDTDLSFTAAEINEIYDRLFIVSEPRVQINYGISDSEDYFRIYMDPADITSVIRIDFSGPSGARSATILRDGDGDGGGDNGGGAGGGDNGGGDNGGGDNGGGDNGGGGDTGGGTAEDLGNNSGVTGIFGGVPRINTSVRDFTGPPLSVGTAYFDVGQQSDAFRVSVSGFGATTANVGQQRACTSIGIPSLTVIIDGVGYNSLETGGSCTIVVTEVTETAVRGTFSGTLVAFQQDPLVVTNGAFQYIVTPFPDGEGDASVALDFDGLATGDLAQKADGTTDSGLQGLWSFGTGTVADRTSAPLTYSLGDTSLEGGDRAVRLQSLSPFTGPSRLFANVLQSDVYISYLVRVEGDVSPSRSYVTLGNLAVYIGLDTNDATNQFVVSLGDGDSTKARAGGTLAANETYLVVGRIYKNAPLDDHYSRFDLWVNPSIDDANSPLATAERTRGTGSLMSVSAIGFAGANQFQPAFYDRIRVSDSWEGLFSDAGATGGDEGGDGGDSGAGNFVGNGVTGSINGTQITHQALSVLTGNLSVVLAATPPTFDFAVTYGVGANGMVTIEGASSNFIDKWRLIFPESVGTHSCTGENAATLQYIDSTGGVFSATASAAGGNCSIEVLQVGSVYEANFSGGMLGGVSGQTLQVTGGYLLINTQEANP